MFVGAEGALGTLPRFLFLSHTRTGSTRAYKLQAGPPFTLAVSQLQAAYK